MCGIIGATGAADALEVVLDGLHRLEYRGYDSAGVALVAEGDLWRARAAEGPSSVDTLAGLCRGAPARPAHGDRPHPLGHPRQPHAENAHPHLDCTAAWPGAQRDHREPRASWPRGWWPGATGSASETDTEVLAHLIEEEVAAGRRWPRRCAPWWPGARVVLGGRRLGRRAHGDRGRPPGGPARGGDRRASALLASDIPALLGRTRRLFALDDDQLAELGRATLG